MISAILKNWKVSVLTLFVIISLAMISPWEKPGVAVDYIDEDSDFYGVLAPGDIIFTLNGDEASVDAFNNISGRVTLDTSRGKIDKVISFSGISVSDRPFSNVQFGLDVEGGLLAVVAPEGNISDDILLDIKSILDKRMSSLREASFQIVKYDDEKFIQIQIAGGTEEDLKKIINTTGTFEAKIPMPVDMKNGTGQLKFGEESSWLEIGSASNSTLLVNGDQLGINETFVHENATFEIWDIGDDSALIAATVYRNDGMRKDIAKVYIDPQHSFVQASASGGYTWRFDVEVTPSASETFYKSVKNLKISYSGTDAYLESKIYLYLDGKEMSNLSIGSTLRNRPVTTATVSGGASTKEEALDEKRWLQTILQSGALPANLEITSIRTISPKLGENFLFYTGIAFLAAVAAVSTIVFVRYRKINISLMVIVTCLSEIIIILGSSVVIGWTLDLAAIAGIIAVIGTGVDQQIMIIDEILIGERTWSLKSKIERALFIVFGSAGTVLAAMLPLMTLGFGMLKGFAITTALGVLIAIIITRPAFTAVVERIMK